MNGGLIMDRKRFTALILTVVMIVLSVFPVSASTGYSANWKQDKNGKWFVQKTDGSVIKNAWFGDDSNPAEIKWYVLGSDGFMVEAPLVCDKNGTYYSIETAHNGNFGMMRNKSGVYDGISITINENHNATYGAVTNKEAIDALKKKYGVVNMEIDNSNIIYASRLVSSGISTSSSSSSRVRPSANVDIKIPAAPGTYKYGVGTLVVTEDSAEYLNLTGTAQNVKLTSNGKSIVINAPLDEIRHYGSADSIIVKAVADASYYGYADADSLEANAGHIVLNSSIDKLSITAEKDMEIDVEKNAVIPAIEVGADEDRSIELTVNGDVQTVKSSTGELTFTVGPDAPQVPKLEFVGEEAVRAYENRIHEMLKEKKTFTVNLREGDGEIQSHECGTTYTEAYGTEVEPWDISGRTFEDDVYIDGDFGKIRFIACHFKGNVINRGSESTIVQFVFCSFDESAECRIENNGRNSTIDDLVSKFMFIATTPVNVVCRGSNGSVVSVETSDPIIYNDGVHSISDAEYFVDQRPAAFTTAVQEYEGQAAGIYYYGEFNSLDGRKTINLTVYDSEIKEEDKVSIYRAYIKMNWDIYELDGYPKSYTDAVFTFASPSEASISEGDIYITAPYNRVIFDGFTFAGQVSVEGLYSKFIFRNCDFGGKPVLIKSPEVEIIFEDCEKASPETTEDIDDSYYELLDGPVDD